MYFASGPIREHEDLVNSMERWVAVHLALFLEFWKMLFDRGAPNMSKACTWSAQALILELASPFVWLEVDWLQSKSLTTMALCLKGLGQCCIAFEWQEWYKGWHKARRFESTQLPPSRSAGYLMQGPVIVSLTAFVPWG